MVLVATVVVVAGVALAGSVVRSDPQSPELLNEVRALRLAVERLATDGARSQVLLGRVQLQERRVADIARRLESVDYRLPAGLSVLPLENEEVRFGV
jgi:hypothetical protein